MNVSKIMILASVVCFTFAAFGFSPGTLALVPLGLAIWAAAMLVA